MILWEVMLIIGLGKKTIKKLSALFFLVLVLMFVPPGCKKQESQDKPSQQIVQEGNQAPEKPVVQAAPAKQTVPAKPAVSEQLASAKAPYEQPMATVSSKTLELKKSSESADSVQEFTKAVAQNDIDGVQSLIKQGADVNANIKGGVTFLHIALLQGHEEIAALLIAGGSDTRAKMMDGTTPLHLAAMRNCRLVTEFLLDDDADVNAPGSNQSTPLHLAATGGHKEIVELLIARGADLNAKDQSGRTPLELAKQKGHSELYELLGEKKAEQ